MSGKSDQATHLFAVEKIASLPPSTKAAIRAHLDEIVAHPHFRGSRRCEELLRFIVLRALSGCFDQLKERVIGNEVFGRPASYDTGSDAVVRVSANELRKRLAQWYHQHGSSCPIRIDVPTGSYIPDFHFQSPAQPAVLVAPAPEPKTIAEREAPRFSRITLFAWSIAILAFGVAAWLWMENHQLRAAMGDPQFAKILPWSIVLDKSHETYIVMADVARGAAQDILHSELTLQDYIANNLPVTKNVNHETVSFATFLSRKRFTSLADASIASKIMQMAPRNQRRVSIHFARDMHVADFKSNNAILVGSKRANMWVELFESRLNFQVVHDEQLGRQVCRNLAPKPGEQKVYIPAGTTGTPGQAYAVVALVPNLNSTGYVLLIEGTNMEGTEAAGEFLMDFDRLSAGLKKIGLTRSRQSFELLLRLNATGGTSERSEVIASRLIDG